MELENHKLMHEWKRESMDSLPLKWEKNIKEEEFKWRALVRDNEGRRFVLKI
jgi:hypothetical protein